MTRLGKASAWTAFMTLALGPGCSTSSSDTAPDTGSGGGGTGGGGTTVASTTGSGTGGFTSQCDPAAEPGSIYETSAVTYDIDQIDPVAMCKYRGDVMLVVNTAAL